MSTNRVWLPDDGIVDEVAVERAMTYAQRGWPAPALSPQERDVVIRRLAEQGVPDRLIGLGIGISSRHVHRHRLRMGVESRFDRATAVHYAQT